ncbi:hypothetical protein DFH28DRAFT_1126244 [Melampsora americana]|nr:hypothetical protein DFH28DRAFT_1126244 [Melampsora americana]
MSYSQLLQHIQSIQRVFDEEPSSSNGSQKPNLPVLMLKIWYAEATILDVEGGKNLIDQEVESWLEALEIKRLGLNELEKLSIEFNLKNSLVDYLPTPGSEDWLNFSGFLHRMIEE